MIVPTQNKRLAEEYYNSLPPSDVSRRYYEEGLKYNKPTSFFGRLRAYMDIPNKISHLKGFYPYHRTVQATEEEYYSDWRKYIERSLIFTGVAWFSLFNTARFGYVLPLLREYGRFFRTHRLFRHYVHALVLPLLYTEYHMATKYFDHVETLWTIHANRLNQKLLDDPSGTIYPKEIDDKLRITYI